MQAVRQDLQTVKHAVYPSSDPLRHQALSLPVLRQAVPPEVGYEEAYLYSYW